MKKSASGGWWASSLELSQLGMCEHCNFPICDEQESDPDPSGERRKTGCVLPANMSDAPCARAAKIVGKVEKTAEEQYYAIWEGIKSRSL